RPTPLHRAYGLEKDLGIEGDDIKIFYKNESVSTTGSHKPNTALAQAFYAKKEGLKQLVTETGAGQWGSALSYGCNLFGLTCIVYMVRASYIQKPGRKILMKAYNGEVHASPSKHTMSGRLFYDKNPEHPGSLGIAISEAVEHSLTRDDARYSLGSVLNFVCLHQTIIGQETKIQLSKVGISEPDIIIGCMGGGSNFSGLALPFMRDKLEGKLPNTQFIGVEPRACPSVTKGEYRWDYGDTAKKAPILKMHTVGHGFIPHPIHAGGLRYHGIAPIISNLINNNLMTSSMHFQTEVIEAGLQFARTEGILPAPETCHAIKEAIDQAKLAKENNEKKVIVFNFSGHGYFDLLAYKEYMEGNLIDYELPSEEISDALNSSDMPIIDESKF
ncbi:MAG: TrpB-like pyridoxal phosphate-dependent enzyme, partial [Candidatus Lokiarchaeota archaeon]|nr:TrpB-like pyridoxal phosphate-dependent enzyme [Candidatus Lokiarchaeota archaeon]